MANKSTQVLIDWLSISGTSRGIQEVKTKKVILPFGTSVFSRIEEIYYENERLATVTSKPHSSIIDEDLHIVKLDNWVLYSDNFYNLFELIIQETRIYNYKISRIDIAKDFNTFYYNLLPQNLIKGFLSGKYLKLGKSKYSVFGETNKTLTYDYLSFGRKGSPINAYLYNKSHEMQQVTFKPHIVNRWSENGLDIKKDVYRLEFAIKQSELSFVNINSGENFTFDIKNLFDQEMLENLYLWMMSKFFRLKINTGQKNISREENLVLFKYNEFDTIQWEQAKPMVTNRADKIFLRKLDTLYSELRNSDTKIFQAVEMLRDNFAKTKHLEYYLEKKIRPETEQKMEHPSYFQPELKKRSHQVKL